MQLWLDHIKRTLICFIICFTCILLSTDARLDKFPRGGNLGVKTVWFGKKWEDYSNKTITCSTPVVAYCPTIFVKLRENQYCI